MNSIPTAQNAPEQLQLLAAQRAIYSRAKTILATQLILALPVAILLSFAALYFPASRPYTGLAGVVIATFDAVILTKWQASLRKAAAEVQEAFDCAVLGLPWNQVKVKKPSPETIAEWSQRYSDPDNSAPLRDWYRPEFGELPVGIARLYCQRSNIVWDARQRRIYSRILPFMAAGICVLVVTMGLHWQLTMATIVLAAVLPLAPLFRLSYRDYQDHNGAANRQEEIIRQIDGALEREATDASFARAVQDEIYDYRVRSGLVFDWVFKVLRKSSEDRAKGGAQRVLAEQRRPDKKRNVT
ncbi:MAG TPA: S-4TM family putative pore-forming effector [Gammaproteobacteria bacterium]